MTLLLFGYSVFIFGRAGWAWDGPHTVAVSGQWFEVAGPVTDPDLTTRCGPRQPVHVTGLHYCRLPQSSMALLIWYNGDLYAFDTTRPLAFP
ncbi:hypothetical protein [Nocardia crassostreae]|uniref:hypothetical protein n=1 Tax=Nocardia crassostreae TaxID=53428 RepID=UPI00082DD5CD|nr:hypothetical protein [Nocardia crassostreae]